MSRTRRNQPWWRLKWKRLAKFLDQLPNKSDFIRRAIHAQLGIACPLCRGTGKVTEEIHDHFTAFLKKYELHSCEAAATSSPFPKKTWNDCRPR